MTNFNHTQLLEYSNDKSLFRQRLANIIKSLDEENRFELLVYCYKNYSDRYPDVLMEVFFPEYKTEDFDAIADIDLEDK